MHYSENILATVFLIFFRLERNLEVILSFTTLYWISGVMILIMSISEGGTRILARFNPRTIMKHVETYKVRIYLVQIKTSMYI